MEKLLTLCILALVACGGGDAEPDSDTTDTAEPFGEWSIAATRALPVVPAAYGVRARGDVILLRTSDGLSRSDDAGATFVAWTQDRTLDVVPLADDGALQVRADDGLVLERLDAAGVATALPIAWPADLTWSGAQLVAGHARTLLVATTTRGDAPGPTRVFVVDDMLTELAPPDSDDGASWLAAELGERVVLARGDETFIQHEGWRAHPTPGLIDHVGTDDGALVQSRVADGAASLVRLTFEAGEITERATPSPMVMTLTRAEDGELFAVSRTFADPVSVSGQVIMRSRDDGRTWETLARSLDTSSALQPDVAVATSGLWTIDLMFPTWRPHDVPRAPWRIAGLSRELSIDHLQAHGDERWFVGYRAPLFGELEGGAFVFYSRDRGATWQLGGNVGVNVGCFTVTPDFLFFGGGGDVRGAHYETRDRTGRELIHNGMMRVEARPEAATLPIIACAAAGGPSVLVSQAEEGKVPSLMHSANFQHQVSSPEPIDWYPWPLDPDRRVTALDGDGLGIDPILAAGEDLIMDVVGFDSLPATAFYDSSAAGFVWSQDYFWNLLGARGATRRHGWLFVYPTGDFQRVGDNRTSTTGLEDAGVVRDVVDDGHGVVWIGAEHGLYRDGEPVAPPLTGCDVDADCPGFDGSDLCRAQTRCRDNACVPTPAETCAAHVPSAPCRRFSCEPATGACLEGLAEDFAPCGAQTLCTEPSYCQSGACVGGGPIVCAGSTECGAMVCDPLRGCDVDFTAPGMLCGADACMAPGRCTGASKDCIGAGSLECDDDNPCTDDGCDPASGCTHTPRDGACDDANLCTDGDTCVDGQCAGSVANEGAACSDPCMLGEACQDGACGAPRACPDDGNPCTSDACVPGRGCVYAPITPAPGAEPIACSHGDPCRGEGTCQLGWCVGGELAADGTACTSGDACVTAEVCHGGSCGGGHASPDGASCDDGFTCTSADRCERGFCVGDTSGTCEGLTACASCASPAGPALIVSWAHPSGAGGLHVLSQRGALLDSITPADARVSGVTLDPDEGLWVTGSGAESRLRIYRVDWSGAPLETVNVTANVANFEVAGAIDHVPADAWDGDDVFVLKLGSQQKQVAVIDRASGQVLMASLTIGNGRGVLVDRIEGTPIIWTGDSSERLVHGASDIDAEVLMHPPLGSIRGITRDARGDFWLVAVGFDSVVARVSPSGQVLHVAHMHFAGFSTGSDEPQAHDLTWWPGRDGARDRPRD